MCRFPNKVRSTNTRSEPLAEGERPGRVHDYLRANIWNFRQAFETGYIACVLQAQWEFPAPAAPLLPGAEQTSRKDIPRLIEAAG